MGGSARPLGEDVSGPLRDSAVTPAQTLTARENFHLRRKSAQLRFFLLKSKHFNCNPSQNDVSQRTAHIVINMLRL